MKTETASSMTKSNYTQWTPVTLRFGDTDGLGHINNAVFATLLESGRIPLFHDKAGWLEGPGRYWVIANLNIDFRAEMHYPGTVAVGSTIESFGTSSVKLRQSIFQDDKCCATSTSTCVLIDRASKKGTPVDDALRKLILERANQSKGLGFAEPAT